MRKPVGRAYNRDISLRKAKHKKKVSDKWMLSGVWNRSYYPYLGMYRKGKIHCSCGMCSRFSKTNNKGPRRRRIHGNFAPSYNPSISDRRKLLAMDENEREYFDPYYQGALLLDDEVFYTWLFDLDKEDT